MANNRLFIGHKKHRIYLYIGKTYNENLSYARFDNSELLDSFIEQSTVYEANTGQDTGLFFFTENDDFSLNGWFEIINMNGDGDLCGLNGEPFNF